jgi:hypothetical protein
MGKNFTGDMSKRRDENLIPHVKRIERIMAKEQAKNPEAPLKSFMDIDQNRLDESWLDQPKLYLKYATKLADAKLDYDEAKARLDVTKAEIELKVREDPEKFAVKKVTEAVIESTVVADETVQEAQKEVNLSKHRVNILEAAVNALEHRKRTLENLVTLHGQSYFATPSAKGAGREAREEMVKKRVASKGVRDADDDD